jgi:hypothetical protein
MHARTCAHKYMHFKGNPITQRALIDYIILVKSRHSVIYFSDMVMGITVKVQHLSRPLPGTG